MRENYVKILLALGLLLPSSGSLAADKEIILDKDKSVDMAISIYNNSLGFVRDTREVMLEKGSSSVAFVGVADQIKPETAMLSGSGVTVTEQNYNYNLLTPYNILNESVGQTVKTALYNEQTGQTVFNSAKIIDSNNGRRFCNSITVSRPISRGASFMKNCRKTLLPGRRWTFRSTTRRPVPKSWNLPI